MSEAAAVPESQTPQQQSSESVDARVHKKPPRRRRLPSAGFVTLCLVYAGVGFFFVWGLWTPDLDRVWTLHHELKAGRMGAPSPHERDVLVATLQRHDELAHALLQHGEIGLISSHAEGFIAMPEATIVRTAKAEERYMALEIETPQQLLPFTMELRGQGWKQKVEIKQRGAQSVELPKLTRGAEVITVRIKGKELRADPSVLGVRITFAKARA